jgi:hypothetical protein
MTDKIKNKESFVFYRSFYEAIQMLPSEDRLQIYDAISELALNGNQTETTGYASVVMKLIEPQILANNRKYKSGCKGGRPKNQTETKPKPKSNQTETKPKPNVNVNVNVNKNENENGEGLDAFNNAIDFPGNYPEKLDDYLDEKPW